MKLLNKSSGLAMLTILLLLLGVDQRVFASTIEYPSFLQDSFKNSTVHSSITYSPNKCAISIIFENATISLVSDPKEIKTGALAVAWRAEVLPSSVPRKLRADIRYSFVGEHLARREIIATLNTEIRNIRNAPDDGSGFLSLETTLSPHQRIVSGIIAPHIAIPASSYGNTEITLDSLDLAINNDSEGICSNNKQ
jgi:hypothetical protein